MKKNFLQDVVPPSQKRSIRDIPIPRHKDFSEQERETNQKVEEKEAPTPHSSDIKIKKRLTPNPEIRPPQKESRPETDNDFNEPPQKEDSSYFFEEDKPRKRFGKLFISIGILLIITAIILLNRSSAEVYVWAKSDKTTANESYIIEDENMNTNSEVLTYRQLPIQKEASVIVEPSGEEEVSEKASGQIKIINEYSSEDQRLVENTRFENDKGLVYRIAESVSVPGYTEIDGQIIPGEIEVEVFADEPGSDYNSKQSDLTIPGFEGLPQFDSFYAEGMSDMSGGFIGTKKIVSEDDKESGLEELKNSVKTQITTEIENYKDEFLIIFNESDIEYSNLTENDLNSGVELKITGKVNAYAFNINELAKFIVDKNIPNSPEGSVTITNPNEISLNIITSEILNEEDEIIGDQKSISVIGDINIQWEIDADELKQALARKDRGQFTQIISDFEEISKAEIDFSPFWKNKLPKAEDIEITIESSID